MAAAPALKRGIRFRDLTLFYVVSGLSVRRTAMAAALLCFFVPLGAHHAPQGKPRAQCIGPRIASNPFR
jgi:hypothetical protein